MFLIDKIKFKFKNLLQFEKLNPIDDFEFTESIAYRPSDENIMLFEKAIKKHLNLKEVIWIAIYHCLNSFNFENECLTVLSTDLNLIVDLFEGNDSNVVVPQSVKSEHQKGNVLATFHNHYSGSILPSINDFNNSILPKLNFTVITSRNIFGIIVNDNDSLSPDNFQLLINDFKLFEIYLNFCFTTEEVDNIKCLKKDFRGNEFIKRREILFNNYVFNNFEKFVAEFNDRMEKYNVYLIYIKL